VFLRVAAILTTIPLFESRAIPVLVKVGLALAVSVLLLPMLDTDGLVFPGEALLLVLGILREILLGAAIGLTVKLLFAGVQMAGQIVGFQMGIALANVVDPATSDQLPFLAEFNQIVAMLVFVAVNAHHLLIRALVDSFDRIPLMSFQVNGAVMDRLLHTGGQMFVTAIQVGAPLIAVLLLTSVALGLVARTVPQMQVFIVAMPLKVMLGLLFIGIGLPYLMPMLQELFGDLHRDVLTLMAAGRGS
jgi:flagellar biosynthetic protein FliR